MGYVQDKLTFVGPRFTRDLRHRGTAALAVAALAVLSLALLTGCKSPGASMSGYFRVKALNNAIADYNKFVRFQEWDQAGAYLKIDDQDAFTEKMENQEDSFRLTDFEVRDTQPGSDLKSAKVRVIYHYYWLPSITEEKMSVLQRWTWLDNEKRWSIENPLAFPKRHTAKTRSSASARADSDEGPPSAAGAYSGRAEEGKDPGGN